MKQIDQNLIGEKIQKLPQDIRDALFDPANTQEIMSVGKTHGLMVDKMGELGDETTLVMLGITPTADFIKNLSERLGVDKEKAKAIAEDINQKVFQPIKVSLRKVHGLPASPSLGGPDEPKVPAPTPTASPYVIPMKPVVAPINPLTPEKRSDFPGKTDLKEGEKKPPAPIKPTSPASTVVIGDTKLDFAPLPVAKKLDSASLQLNPPPAPSGIRTMFQDAKSFLAPKKAENIVKTTEPLITMPKQEKYNVTPARNVTPASNASRSDAGWQSVAGGPPNLPVVSKPETTIINMPPKPEPTTGLKQEDVKAEIENALGGKIKVADPYKEPIE